MAHLRDCAAREQRIQVEGFWWLGDRHLLERVVAEDRAASAPVQPEALPRYCAHRTVRLRQEALRLRTLRLRRTGLRVKRRIEVRPALLDLCANPLRELDEKVRRL